MASIYIDIAELVRNPLRTGIQRVVRELLTHWPVDVPVTIVRYQDSPDRLQRVPDAAVQMVIESASNPYLDEQVFVEDIKRALQEGNSEPVVPGPGDWIFVPELFVSLQRASFYEAQKARGVRLALIAYDFLGWLSPDQVAIEKTGGLNHYLQVLKIADRRCFISSAVREEFYSRILRLPVQEDAVLPLGADGLRSIGKPVIDADAPFLCPGALDGRKGQDLVFDAFINNSACRDFSLTFAGRVPPRPRPNLEPLLAYRGSRVRVLDNPDDAALAAAIASSRACLFVSQYEGFGLPAIESLYLGVPVVVSADLPAVSDLPDFGQLRLKTVDRQSISDALTRLASPDEIGRLASDTGKLQLRTWRDYAISVAAWVCA